MDADQAGLREGDPFEGEFLDGRKRGLENADGPKPSEHDQ